MNDVVGERRTVIEVALDVDENGMTTARKLYDWLGLTPGNYSRWCKSNILDNDFAEEGVDYWLFFIDEEQRWQANPTTDYKLTAHFAKKLSMKGNGERAEQAREYFTRIEEKAKEVAINRSNLSPTLQMVYALADQQAKVEMEQKRQAEQIERIEQKQEAITETFATTKDTEDFKEWVNRSITKIVDSPRFTNGSTKNIRYANARNESYQRLKKKWRCNLDDRVSRAKGRALENRPNIKKTELDSINKLSVIADDKSLRPCYETVIREMMIFYCV